VRALVEEVEIVVGEATHRAPRAYYDARMSAADARTRFTTATTIHLSAPLAPGVAIRHVDEAEWHTEVDPMWAGTLDRPGLELGPLFSSEQSAAFRDLDAIVGDRLQHRLLFEVDGSTVGGYWGQQETFGRYYMTVTVFHPDWRGKGLYTALLARVTAAAADAGFREMYSRHRADNNAILVPKLRAGWLIAAFEVAPRWGLTIHLRKYLLESLTLVHQHRVDGANVDALRERGLKLP
jgi:GNAT superfamily N-acetyltransferase